MSKINKVYYDIESDNVNKKIILLTDIHYYKAKDKKKLDKILESLKEEKSDYVCISGDMIDVGQIKDMDILINFLSKLACNYKVIISLGGHDLISDKMKEFYYNTELYSKIKELKNVYLLDNDIYEDGNIRFIGLTMPVDFYYKYKENSNYFKRFVNNTFNEFKDKYNILLSHTPIPFTRTTEYKDIKLLNNIKLVLSGHMHAGIVPKFLRSKMKGRGIFSPGSNQGMFPKDAYGHVKRENMDIIISSGVTKASHSNPLPFADVFFDIEITIINIKARS